MLSGNIKRLPTVSDFMETELQDDGSLKILEKSVSDESLRRVEEKGRGDTYILSSVLRN